jgi:hypothetical protein
MNPRRSAKLAVIGAASPLVFCACSAKDPGGPAQGRTVAGGSESTYGGTGTPNPPASASDASVTAAPDASVAQDAGPASAILSFTLLDASQTGLLGVAVSGFDPIPANATISLGQVGTLSIRANVGTNTIGSIGFSYNGTNHTENAAPYVLCGDDGAGTMTNCNLAAGTLQVTATPYSAADLGGTAGIPRTVTITITP